MSKHIIKNELGLFYKLVEDDASKNHWLFNYPTYSSEAVSDADALDFVTGRKVILNTDNFSLSNLTTTFTDASVTINSFLADYTKEQLDAQLNKLISKIEQNIESHENPPSIWTTSLNSLKAIDTNSLTFPINGLSWVDCFEKNGIHIPSSLEF